MSKAEFLRQLETLSPAELDDVMERVTILRHAQDRDDLTFDERKMLEERMEQYERDGNKGEAVEVVMARLRASLKQ